MTDTIVSLERQPKAPEVECNVFLRCLYSRLDEKRGHRDPSGDTESWSQVSDEIQHVTVPGAENLLEGRVVLDLAAKACDPGWERLYRFTAE